MKFEKLAKEMIAEKIKKSDKITPIMVQKLMVEISEYVFDATKQKSLELATQCLYDWGIDPIVFEAENNILALEGDDLEL